MLFAGSIVDWDEDRVREHISGGVSSVYLKVVAKDGREFEIDATQVEVIPESGKTVVNVSGSIDPKLLEEKAAEDIFNRIDRIANKQKDDAEADSDNKWIEYKWMEYKSYKIPVKDLRLGLLIKFGDGNSEPNMITGLEISYVNTVTISYTDANGYTDRTTKDFNSLVTVV